MKQMIFLWAALCASLTGPALAAEPREAKPEVAAKVLDTYAKCIVSQKASYASSFVLTVGRLPQDEYDELIEPRCMKMWVGKLKMNGFRFRAALAEALIDRQPIALDSAELGRVEPLNWLVPVPFTALDPDTGKQISDDELPKARQAHDAKVAAYFDYLIGECVVRSKPASVLQLVGTKPNSAEELASFKELSPHIVDCVPQGEAVRFLRANLRAALATSYYRLAHAKAKPELLTNTDASE